MGGEWLFGGHNAPPPPPNGKKCCRKKKKKEHNCGIMKAPFFEKIHVLISRVI
jgi:hypothetical protein